MGKKQIVPSDMIEADLAYQTSLGNVEGRGLRYKFGRSESITTSESILWDGGNGYEFQETASILDVVSSSTADTNGGANAHSIRIFGLDGDFNEIEEDVLLNGTTAVQTTNQFIRVFSSKVIATGNGIFTPNAGDISINVAGGGDLQAQIKAKQGQTQMCVYTVPAGYTALVPEVTYSSGEGKNITMRLRVREFGGAFTTKAVREVFQQNVVIPVSPPLVYSEKTDIVITGTADTGTQKGSASFNIILVKNDTI